MDKCNYSFPADLKASEKSINMVVQFLQEKGAKSIRINNDNRFDISCLYKGNNETLEVKEDKQFHTTLNVAFEYNSRNKQSGYSTSRAKTWCYVLNRGIGYDGIYMVRLHDLKRYIQSTPGIIKRGGDNDTSDLYLMPITKFIKLFKKVSAP